MLVPSVCLLLLLAAVAPAQEFRATLTGAASDAQDARIPGAAIAVTQSTTGAKFTMVSTASRQYPVPLLTPEIRFNTVPSQQLAPNIRLFPQRISSLRAERIVHLDAGAIRDIPTVERFRAQVRADAFNLANRTQFSTPSLSPTSAIRQGDLAGKLVARHPSPPCDWFGDRCVTAGGAAVADRSRPDRCLPW